MVKATKQTYETGQIDFL